jgi:uncharacterized protein (TIGR00730 family)
MITRSLCVYCSSSDTIPNGHRKCARKLGQLLAKNDIHMVTGGGHVGLMGETADAALAAGGEVTGIVPHFIKRLELVHRGLTRLIEVESMHERKQKMFDMSDAFAALPGGLGTLDETFEIITWKHLGLHNRPIFLIEAGGYWKPFHNLFEHMIATGYARQGCRDLYTVATNPEQVIAALKALPVTHEDEDSSRI